MLDPVDADHTAAWKGTAVHDVLEQWLAEDDCDPDELLAARPEVARRRGDPPDAARLVAAAADRGDRLDRRRRSASNRAAGRRPLAAEIEGEHRDRRRDASRARPTASTGSPTARSRSSITRPARRPAPKAVEEGFALQLGLLGLIAEQAGSRRSPASRARTNIGRWPRTRTSSARCRRPTPSSGAAAFLDHAERHFAAAAAQIADRRRAVHRQAQPGLCALRRLRPADAARGMVRPRLSASYLPRFGFLTFDA